MTDTNDVEPNQAEPNYDLSPRELRKWLDDVVRDQELLRYLVRHMRGKKRANRTDLSNAALNWAASGGDLAPADYSPTRFSNWIRGTIEHLEQYELANVLQYLVTNLRELEFGPGSDKHGDPDRLVVVVARLNEYLCVSPRNLEGLQGRLEGYYWVYRPSVTAPGRYLRGLLGMRWVDGEVQPGSSKPKGMIRTCEIHRHPGDEGHSMPPLSESYDGFALVKKGILFLFMSERFAGHDRGSLLITRMHAFLPADRKRPLQMAWGHATGASGPAHALPVVIVRVTDEEMLDKSGEKKSPVDLERHWVFERDNKARPHHAAYLQRLLEKCEIVDASDLPPTVLAQVDAMNREAWWFAEQFRRDPSR